MQIPTHEACRAEVLTSYAENDSLVRRGCCSLLDGELEQRCVVPHNKMYCVVVKQYGDGSFLSEGARVRRACLRMKFRRRYKFPCSY